MNYRDNETLATVVEHFQMEYRNCGLLADAEEIVGLMDDDEDGMWFDISRVASPADEVVFHDREDDTNLYEFRSGEASHFYQEQFIEPLLQWFDEEDFLVNDEHDGWPARIPVADPDTNIVVASYLNPEGIR